MKSGTNGTLAARFRKYFFPILVFALLVIPSVGIWELFQADRPYPTHVSRLLVVFLAFMLFAITALVTGYVTTRELLADAKEAHQRLATGDGDGLRKIGGLGMGSRE